MEKRKLRFGILGCGMVARVHAEAILGLDEAELYGVADGKLAAAEAFAQKYGARAFESYEQMLNDESVDAVCICTPSYFHEQNAIDALLAGKNVVLEKPMALTTEAADRIIKTCEQTGKLLTVISQLRFSDDVLRVKGLVESGALGKITLCELRMKYYRSDEYFSGSDWRGRMKFEGGGALMNQGIHGVDVLEFLLGRVKRANGKIRTLSHPVEVEDTAVATVEFENGALGVIVGSTCAYPGFERKVEIHGDRGFAILKENKLERLMIDGVEQPLAEVGEVGTAGDPNAVKCDGHRKQIRNLIAAVFGEEKLVIDCYEGKKALRLIKEIYRTSELDKNNEEVLL